MISKKGTLRADAGRDQPICAATEERAPQNTEIPRNRQRDKILRNAAPLAAARRCAHTYRGKASAGGSARNTRREARAMHRGSKNAANKEMPEAPAGSGHRRRQAENHAPNREDGKEKWRQPVKTDACIFEECRKKLKGAMTRVLGPPKRRSRGELECRRAFATSPVHRSVQGAGEATDSAPGNSGDGAGVKRRKHPRTIGRSHVYYPASRARETSPPKRR